MITNHRYTSETEASLRRNYGPPHRFSKRPRQNALEAVVVSGQRTSAAAIREVTTNRSDLVARAAEIRTTEMRVRTVAPVVREGGYVLLYAGRGFGWVADLNQPQKAIPGVVAVGEDGSIFVAQGGNFWRGAKRFVAVAEPTSERSAAK